VMVLPPPTTFLEVFVYDCGFLESNYIIAVGVVLEL
jgi:hypothetical protein